MPVQLAQQPEWAKPLYQPFRYKVLYGGRGSGKSWAVSQYLVTAATQAPLRIACLREKQVSIKESSKRIIEGWIDRLGLRGFYDIQTTQIVGKNGSLFFFSGMSTTTEDSVRSWEDIDKVWFEEAQKMSIRSREILYPTIRKPGSELLFTLNPRFPADPIYIDFVAGRRRDAKAFVKKVNYYDNPWFTEELEQERILCERDEAERYSHVWLGDLDTIGEGRKVIPYKLLKICIDLYPRFHKQASVGPFYIGFDVADEGEDRNCGVLRQGGVLTKHSIEMWKENYIHQSVKRIDNKAREFGVKSVYYDVTGLGAGVRSDFEVIRQQIGLPYKPRPENFAGRVKGDRTNYTPTLTNKQMFLRRNMQLAWALRLRADRTALLAAGNTKVSPESALFIDPDMTDIDEFVGQLSQPFWDEDVQGAKRLHKKGEGEMSPDMFDGTALAFAHDSRYGLVSNVGL